ncbi:MAG: metal-sensitive transcriptional regulator [Alphaproteobacteria bacterium]|jgi:CsoR family transcriptional regulator, copper-sensing transcriptional repressor|uniref:Metal-sensitive transcriptional regulator n=1 Tax=Brevundimonas aurifodinae TaxID=1508312 RepID=A0ABV1NK09_9CAUL|nr:metal-sensitive transcriptional regulator [Alphaproteobacteria bacterium]OYW39206.1 MAG: transcriptional regulator [Brevundimonas sp. 12-68-7]MBU2042405.1 metal-sensitive transcriptional regulator [Alphaproteobacteria bacterium]MBU2125582.1 metal-sensitive transcriptional regulator [Alphaproteobacteria bacterium]MBU2209428.1 metal-sensitive transcriptional regulator [Alphaproteobacteria bacterium]
MQIENKPKVLNRLNRIEGQVRGIVRMVEDDRYCVDVLAQIQAVRAALARVESEVLKDHLDHCVMGAMTGDDLADRRAKASELIVLLGRASR